MNPTGGAKLIEGLMDVLPVPGEHFTNDEQRRWFNATKGVFDLIYPGAEDAPLVIGTVVDRPQLSAGAADAAGNGGAIVADVGGDSRQDHEPDVRTESVQQPADGVSDPDVQSGAAAPVKRRGKRSDPESAPTAEGSTRTFTCEVCPDRPTFPKGQGLGAHNRRRHPRGEAVVAEPAAPRPPPWEPKPVNTGHPDMIIRHGADRYLCSRCDADFPTRAARNLHEKVHPAQDRGRPVGRGIKPMVDRIVRS